jgi:hypothetical protein
MRIGEARNKPILKIIYDQTGCEKMVEMEKENE